MVGNMIFWLTGVRMLSSNTLLRRVWLDSLRSARILLTAFDHYAIQALNANAIHYLLKPVDVDDLKTAVKKLVTTNQLFSENNEQRSGTIGQEMPAWPYGKVIEKSSIADPPYRPHEPFESRYK